ncbi:MAG: putative cytokinetic ring protein SteA [Solirubrobacterales bacterium]
MQRDLAGTTANEAASAPRGPVVNGTIRPGRRTKLLTKTLEPGQIALIDHKDIDRVSGEELVRKGVSCVINVADSSTGEYPNTGPSIIADAGVHLVDAVGSDLFEQVKDGDQVSVRGGEVVLAGEVIARGEVQSREIVAEKYEQAKRQVGHAIERFAENTMQYIRQESELLSGKLDLPELDTVFRDRPVLVVVRGVDHQRDLQALRSYIRDEKPILIGVDGGGDALMEEGHKPDMIVGDMDSAADSVLTSGAELIVHGYTDGRAPGRERLQKLGVPHKVVAATGTSEDIAMLMAAEEGASLIVTVGAHFNLVEFLDKNRKGMASTFLTRVRIGEILIDAKGVSKLYRPRPSSRALYAVLAAGAFALAVAIFASPSLSNLVDLLWLKFKVTFGIG